MHNRIMLIDIELFLGDKEIKQSGALITQVLRPLGCQHRSGVIFPGLCFRQSHQHHCTQPYQFSIAAPIVQAFVTHTGASVVRGKWLAFQP
ncbi:hypothetical protein D3C71_1460920 [compost metagenome]